MEAGRDVALALPKLNLLADKRLLYRPLTGTSEVAGVGVARASKGQCDSRGRKILRSPAANIYFK